MVSSTSRTQGQNKFVNLDAIKAQVKAGESKAQGKLAQNKKATSSQKITAGKAAPQKAGAKKSQKVGLQGVNFLNQVLKIMHAQSNGKMKKTPSKPTIAKPKMLSSRELTFALEIIMTKLINQSLTTEQKDTIYHKAQDKTLHEKIDNQINKVIANIAKNKVLSKVLEAFGWIATIISVVVSVALAVVSFGAGSYLVAGALLLGVAITAAVMVLSKTGVLENLTNTVGNAITQDLINDGMDKKKAKLAGMILGNIVVSGSIMIIQIAVSIASVVGGAAKLAGKVAEMTNKILKIVIKATTWGARLGTMADSAVSLGEAGGNLYGAYLDEDKSAAQAKKAVFQAVIKYLEQLQSGDQNFIKEMTNLVSGNFKMISNVESSRHEVDDQIAQNTSV